MPYLNFNPYLLVFFIAISSGCVKRTPSTVAAKPVGQESGGYSGDTAPVHSPSTTATQQNMITVKVAIGQTTQIQFEDLNVADYTWYYEVSEDWVISMTEPYDYPSKAATQPKNDKTAGAATQKIYDVKGLKKGTVTIRFYKIRAWEPGGKPKEERYYQVEVGAGQ